MSRFFLLLTSGIFFLSCSLTYREAEPEVSHIPELIFSDAEYISYEEGKTSMVLQTNLLEQYREDSSFYASNVSFSTYTEEGELSAQGYCEMISVDSDDKHYTLLGNVVVDSIEEDMVFKAHSMQWDGKSEQLVTSSSDSINLVRGKRRWDKGGTAEDKEGADTWIEMTGVGFSSSATSVSFDFSGKVSGFIYTRKKQDSQQ